MSKPQGWSRIEVWFLIAVSLVALVGFMSTLSSGDAQEVAGGEDSQPAAHAQAQSDEVK
jgi:hypothetical protein